MKPESVPLESMLAELLPVSPARIDALASRVTTRALREPRTPVRRTRFGAPILIAVAALLVAFLLNATWHRPDNTARLTLARREFTVSRQSSLPTASFGEPPGVCMVAARSDVALIARVMTVDESAVRLQVEEVLFGESLLAEIGLDVPAEPRGWSCSDLLQWTAGERCLLLLTRDAETNRLRVTFDGSGKWGLPIAPYLELPQLRETLREQRLPVARVADAMRTDGPAVLRTALWHAAGLPDWRGLADEPAIQAVLRAWLLERAPGDVVSDADCFTTIFYLQAEGFRDLPRPVSDWLREKYAEVLRSEPNGRFQAFAVLRPLCRSRVVWAHKELERHLDRVSQADTPSVAFSFLIDGIEDLSFTDPETARERLWKLYETLPPDAAQDRRQLWRVAIERGLDPERAEREALSLLEERTGRGFGLPILELLRKGGSTVRKRVQQLFDEPMATPALDSDWINAIETASAAGDLRELAWLLPDWLRASIEHQLQQTESSTSLFVAWLRLRRNYDRDPEPLRALLATRLDDPELEGHDRRALVEELREWIELGATWKELTDVEVEQLRLRLLRQLRR